MHPSYKLNDKTLVGSNCYYYYPPFNSHDFECTTLYIGIEFKYAGTMHIMAKFEAKKFHQNFSKHTQSSMQLVTTKHLSGFSGVEYKKVVNDKIEKLKYDDEQREKFLEHVSEIRYKRNKQISRSNSEYNLSKRPSLDTRHVLRTQQDRDEYLEKHRAQIKAVQERKSRIAQDTRKLRMFKYHRETVFKNVKVKFKALKIAQVWQEKRKARFLKLMMLQTITLKLSDDYTENREIWLLKIRRYLAAFKIYRYWIRHRSQYGIEVDYRNQNMLRYTYCSFIIVKPKLEHKCNFFSLFLTVL